MIFASKAFFVFLPVVLLVYHLLRRRGQKYAFLLIASWLFYAWCSPQYLWVIILCTIIDYAAGLAIEVSESQRHRKLWLFVSIFANLGLLFAFKYTAFAYDNAVSLARLCGMEVTDRAWEILLPLGISFHTFQGISYTVDVYRRQIPAVRNFIDYALFVSFFPQLAAGPIVRAVEFLPQMDTAPKVSATHVIDGLHFFLLGLFKKLFIADQLDALFVSPVFGNPAAFDPTAQRWALIAWAAQIYCDFSGYSDMAVGCAKWFGFELPRNFNFPFLATSITDFWRRWHLSLSTWLRDYVYFPLGGSKGSEVRTYFNLMIVFILCGLWHGATWAWFVYGVYNGVLMSTHRFYDRALTGVAWADAIRGSMPWKFIAWLATMFQIVAGLILIRMVNWESGAKLFESLIATDVWSAWSTSVPVWVPMLILLVVLGHLFSGVRRKVCGLLELPAAMRAAVYVGTVAILIVFAGTGKSFIYIAF